MKPDINSVEFHPQLNNNRHPMDGALAGAGSLWPLIDGPKGRNSMLENRTFCFGELSLFHFF
jgi:hypothetical protein